LPNLKPSTQSISLRLPLHTLDRIKAAATASAVPYQSLIKIWLEEKLSAQGAQRPQVISGHRPAIFLLASEEHAVVRRRRREHGIGIRGSAAPAASAPKAGCCSGSRARRR
jgi:hypothetical protein